MKYLILFLMMVFGLTSCAPTLSHQFEMGQAIDATKAAQIIEGKTTEPEVITLLGPPQTTQQRPDGSRVLIYNHYRSQMGGPSAAAMQGGISNEMLVLGIRDGIVKKKWQNSSYQPTSTFTGITK